METNTAISLSAVFIALSALATSIWQGVISRKHNKLSVRPNLVLDHYEENSLTTSFTLKNNGLGPALISSFQITFDQNEILNEQSHANAKTIASKLGIPRISCSLYKPSVSQGISNSDQYQLLIFDTKNATHEEIEVLKTLRDRLQFNIEYTSIYGEKFKLNGNN